jgi:hypothetical protein
MLGSESEYYSANRFTVVGVSFRHAGFCPDVGENNPSHKGHEESRARARVGIHHVPRR